jgi:hypothetical protein
VVVVHSPGLDIQLSTGAVNRHPISKPTSKCWIREVGDRLEWPANNIASPFNPAHRSYKVIDSAIKGRITRSRSEEKLNTNTSDTYITPSIRMVLTPKWAEVKPANNKTRFKMAILKRVYKCNGKSNQYECCF